jgi:hypothetical protein
MPSIRECSTCGSALPTESLQGLCPKCLLRVGLNETSLPPGMSGTRVPSPSEIVSHPMPEMTITRGPAPRHRLRPGQASRGRSRGDTDRNRRIHASRTSRRRVQESNNGRRHLQPRSHPLHPPDRRTALPWSVSRHPAPDQLRGASPTKNDRRSDMPDPSMAWLSAPTASGLPQQVMTARSRSGWVTIAESAASSSLFSSSTSGVVRFGFQPLRCLDEGTGLG